MIEIAHRFGIFVIDENFNMGNIAKIIADNCDPENIEKVLKPSLRLETKNTEEIANFLVRYAKTKDELIEIGQKVGLCIVKISQLDELINLLYEKLTIENIGFCS